MPQSPLCRGDAELRLTAEVKGRSRRVHIPLGGDAYDQAILAHRNRLPLIVTGDLVFQGRSWSLSYSV